jgi:hypothetical protein
MADDRDDPAKLIRDALGIESGEGANCGFIHTPSREDAACDQFLIALEIDQANVGTCLNNTAARS